MHIKDRARKWLKEPPPDNGEPEPEDIASAREIILGLLNLCNDNDEQFDAVSKEADRRRERVMVLGRAISQAVRRLEEVERRGGGPDWIRAKELLKSDLHLIQGGLQATYPE